MDLPSGTSDRTGFPRAATCNPQCRMPDIRVSDTRTSYTPRRARSRHTTEVISECRAASRIAGLVASGSSAALPAPAVVGLPISDGKSALLGGLPVIPGLGDGVVIAPIEQHDHAIVSLKIRRQ